jgi:hypothetical protein
LVATPLGSKETGMDAFRAVGDFLRAKYRLDLEDVLCEGCLVGRITAKLGAIAKIMPRLVRSQSEDDGGAWSVYDGVLILDGIWYRFACQIFVDAGGLRFLADLSAFDAVEWNVRLAV